jgi:hypothetical protein
MQSGIWVSDHALKLMNSWTIQRHRHSTYSDSVLAGQLRQEIGSGQAVKGLATMQEFRDSIITITRAKAFLDLLLGDKGGEILIAGNELASDCTVLSALAIDPKKDLEAGVRKMTGTRERFRRLVLTELNMSWWRRRRKVRR